MRPIEIAERLGETDEKGKAKIRKLVRKMANNEEIKESDQRSGYYTLHSDHNGHSVGQSLPDVFSEIIE